MAMQLALDYPQYLKKLVVLDVTPVPKPGLSDLHHVLPALLKVDLTTLHSRKEVDAALQYTVPVSPWVDVGDPSVYMWPNKQEIGGLVVM